MKISNKSIYLILIGLSACLFLTACNKKLTGEQSEKHLKAFDSELIMLTKQVSGTNAFKAISVMVSFDNLPLPLQYTEYSTTGDPIAFDFEKKKGIYRCDIKRNEFYKSEEADSIIIVFPLKSEKDSLAKFIVANYKEEITVWGVMFPTMVDMKLEMANHTLFEVMSLGELAYSVPVKSELTAKFDKYVLNAHLSTKLSKTSGKVKFDIELFKRDEQYIKLDAKLRTTITNQNTMLFEKLKLQCNVFPIEILADVDYGKINPNSRDFINDFNANSSIHIFSEKNEKVGEIKLKERVDSDRLNFAVVYSDQSFAYLEDFLLAFKEIMNMKVY